MLPFDVPTVSRGFASLTVGARAEGVDAARAIAGALAAVLGAEVRIDGRALPASPRDTAGMARVPIALEGLPGEAELEVDAGLLARCAQRLSGTAPTTAAALAASALETSLLGLATLVAIDAARSPRVQALRPRLAMEGGVPAGALAVELELVIGDDRGAGRLRVPAAAVVALGAGAPAGALPPLELPGSFRRGTVSLCGEELAALEPGDVLLVDDGPPRSEIVLPGGLALRGREQDGTLLIEEIQMTETQAAFPITLSVELGRVTLPLRELARLAPGAAVALDLRRDGAVVLRAGERVVARGQLVDVDGALGVRIADLGDAP